MSKERGVIVAEKGIPVCNTFCGERVKRKMDYKSAVVHEI